MPKTAKYTKEQIVQVSIEIIRSEGSGALSARSISKNLGCSISPIFRTYSTMDDLLADVRVNAEEFFLSYFSDICNYMPAFKEFGMRMIRFAKEEPNLFSFVFLESGARDEPSDRKARLCLAQTEQMFDLTPDEAEELYSQIRPFVLGLAQLCNKNPEMFTEDYVSYMLSAQFMAQLVLVKSKREVVDFEPRLIPEGKRVYLRRWRESDAAALYRLASDPELGPRAGWSPHNSEENSLEVIRKYFSNDTTWAVVLKESTEIVGCAGFHTHGNSNIPLGPDEAEVGYWIAKPYWNQGLCTEALELVISFCAGLGTYRTLYGEHFTDNPASGRVMEKCGFSDTGQRRTCPGLQVGADKEVSLKILRLS